MGTGLNRERRVAALETTKRHKDRDPIFIPMIAARLGESSDEAVARYVTNHGPLPEVDDADVNVIVMVPVAPMRRAA